MAWSTREIAELAGTTLKAVRHYHKLGLLAEPERAANGYKHYRVSHLVRLLRIRRLSELGLSLSQIAAMGDSTEHPDEALRLLDAELAATAERIERIRAELALILRQSLPTDLPAELAGAAATLPEADRAMMVVYGRVLDADGIGAWSNFLSGYQRDASAVEFDELPADADEDTRRDVASRLLPHLAGAFREHPEVLTAHHGAPGGIHHVSETIDAAITDVFNEAQLDVLERIRREIAERARRAGLQPG